MMEDAMKKYLKGANRALHVWRIKKDSTLLPILITPDQPVLFDSKHCYLISKYFKGESFDCAHTLGKLKFWVWIGCQCPYYKSVFSPIVQCCRGLSLSKMTVELFAEFQFNESPDFLFWFNTNLAVGPGNSQYHPIIRYSFVGRKELPNYFMILTTIINPKESKNFTSITHVPVCTNEVFPECTYVWFNKRENVVNLRVHAGSKSPEVHDKVVNWIAEQLKRKGDTVDLLMTKGNKLSPEWKAEFGKGGYDYLTENFWGEEEESLKNHKDFADLTVESRPATDAEKKTYNYEAYRIYFENYKTSVKGAMEEEMKNMKMGIYTTNWYTSGWKLHFKPVEIKQGKYLDSKEIIIFNLEKYVVLWMGSSVPLWITSRALSIAIDYLNSILKTDTKFKPYYLLDDLPATQKNFIFVFQGKEPHRFKSLFSKWPIPPTFYYNFPKKRAMRLGFRTEKTTFKPRDSTIKTTVDKETFVYWKCIRSTQQVKGPKEIKKNIPSFPYNLIYGFKIKGQRARLPIYLNRVEVYQYDGTCFIKVLEKYKHIWDTYNTYFVVVTYLCSPNSNPLYCLYLWRGGMSFQS